MAEHLSAADAVAAGIRALPGQGAAFSSTQAAWRFFSNPAVTPHVLLGPLLDAALRSSPLIDRYALVVYDVSFLDYSKQSRRSDRLSVRADKWGYRVLTCLLVSDRDGSPLSVLGMSLWARDGVRTTRSERLEPNVVTLDEVTESIAAIDEVGLDKPCVAIIDREADSIGHVRRWHEGKHSYVIRARRTPKALWGGENLAMGAIAERIELHPAEAIDIGYGVTAQQYVGQTWVTIQRRSYRQAAVGQRRGKRLRVAGPAIDVRLVVSQIRAPDEQIVAEWLLVTNLGEEVGAETIAQWYVWRWRIESYFKLAKSAGHFVEHWQQERAEAVLKRLLVAAMAAVVVWQLGRATGAEAEATRALLVRLSGRQMRRERPWTEPALMAGLRVLLPMLDVLDDYTIDELRRMARRATLGTVHYRTTADDTS